MAFLRNHYDKLVPLISLGLYVFLFLLGVINVTCIDYAIVVTVDIAIAGFLFTSLSIMISASDRPFIKFLNSIGEISKIERVIFVGMVGAIISLFAYFMLAFTPASHDLIKHLLVVGLLEGIVGFAISSTVLFRLLKVSANFEAGKYKHKD